ncbi:MAG: hypothetical protein JWO82_2731, partial [Akkermansiaceae bacterium]|nr:hypothetical protein [Akkermansiaceae bacterium]
LNPIGLGHEKIGMEALIEARLKGAEDWQVAVPKE